MTTRGPRPRRYMVSLQDLAARGIAAVQSAGPVGWVAVVAMVAMALAGFAIYAIVMVVRTMKS